MGIWDFRSFVLSECICNRYITKWCDKLDFTRAWYCVAAIRICKDIIRVFYCGNVDKSTGF